jgi:hypothetical protein
MDRPEVEVARECSATDAVSLATDESGIWKGTAFLVGEVKGWTVFDDQMGFLDSADASELLALAGGRDLVLMSYNDARGSARLVAIEGGTVLRDFSEEPDDPGLCWNRGRLPDETSEPIANWIDVASRMDGPELDYDVDHGILLIFGPPSV